ncbi:hypothetical protein I545_3730 [Mycobacterium kansasii 662]|uniref:Uncharacterized protein n=2 Tax=Mycobacterium kansasii TaxID=1768 RepID=U5WY66_MYCKA|nr:hypothetical protein MKAN_00235 [Mycobacterium kansasii ATCC 12478]EUA17046.1 hypothetical protein I545_3730 [Mycobacterium kansasii 662]KEP41665.1 hypothetical protein MKSMC1_31350 [Mycobacterium kansasii]KZS78564.1 hypothetical protein A4G30_00435 [Mycobacterium kansasii]
MSSAITRAAVPLEHRTGNRQLPIATAEDKSRERRIELEHNTIQCPSPDLAVATQVTAVHPSGTATSGPGAGSVAATGTDSTTTADQKRGQR